MQNTKPLLDTVAAVEAELAKVEAAISSLRRVACTLPGQFNAMYRGPINNLETPEEYNIWVAVENIKSAYALTESMHDTVQGVCQLKKYLQNYKKK